MPDITEYKISDLTTVAQVDEGDFVELSQADASVSGGKKSTKATILALANEIVNGIEYTSALQTTAKKLIGAINEVAQGGGGGSDVEVTPILTEGTKIATITVDNVDADIYGENTKEELGKLSAEKTATGNPVTLETVNGGMAKSCEVTMNPIQDLHGYDSPWPAGAGKNKLDKADSSASANSTWLNAYCNLPAGTYTFSFKSSTTGGQCTFNVFDSNGDRIYQAPNSIQLASIITHTFTISSAGARVSSYINVASNISEVMIEEGSSKTDFAPYSNICPISGRDGVSLFQSGKNSLKATTDESIYYSGYNSYTINNGAVTTSGNTLMGFIVPVVPNTQYAFSFNNSGQVSMRVREYSALPTNWDSNFITQSVNVTKTSGDNFETFTVGENTKYVVCGVYTQTSGITIKNFQLEVGNTATTYEAYNGNTYTATFPDTVCGGTYDFVSGDGGEVWKDYLINDLTLIYSSSGQNFTSQEIPELLTPASSSEKIDGNICEFLKNHEVTRLESGQFAITTDGRIRIKIDGYTTEEDLKTAFGTNKLTLKIATPTPFSTEPTPIELNKGTNVVSTDADSLEIKYSEMMGIDDVKALIDAEGDGVIDYSTEEAEVPNFTFFGEKVYVKAFTFSNVNIGGSIALMTAPSYIGHIVKAWMYTTNESGVEFTSFPAVRVHEGNLYINPYYNSTAVTGKIVLYYTKTS